MSEAEAAVGRDEVWIEKYRPATLEEVVGQEAITSRLAGYVEQEDLPHLLFSGPAGVGKCVTGDTPVLTNRGVERIETVVGDIEGFGAPEEGLEVLTFDEAGEFKYTEPSHVFGKTAEELVRVSTRDGAEMTVTPEHKLLVLDTDGLDWKEAGDIEPGERVVRPLRLPQPEGDGTIDWYSAMDGERTLVRVTEEFATDHGVPAEEDYVGYKKEIVAGLRRGMDERKIAEAVDCTLKTVQDYRRDVANDDLSEPSTRCSLAYLRNLGVSTEELRKHVVDIQWVSRFNARSSPIQPPWRMTPDLAAFLGLVVSEARIDGGRIKFYNTDERLLDRFDRTAMEVFGIEPSPGEQRGVEYRHIGTRTLTHFLESCFDVFDGATGGVGIGSTLVTADRESRAAFLRAVFDAEGHVTENGIIELTQKNEQLVTLLVYLLASLGIPSRRKSELKAATNGTGIEREYHTLYVSGARTLARFRDLIGFTIEQKAERLATNAARESNPNLDTMPTQRAVDHVCEMLFLQKTDLLTETLNPETPGRENYLEDVERVLDAAMAKLEAAQRTLERLDDIAPLTDEVVEVPGKWVGDRNVLRPIEIRNRLSGRTGIREDRLLEYADGRRSPGGQRTGDLLVELGALDERPSIETVQSTISAAVERLNVPYDYVAKGTQLRGTAVINLLENDDHDVSSLARFATVSDRLREIANDLLSTEVLESLRSLHILASSELYYDQVTAVERIENERRVYDLTVPESRNYVAGDVPTVMHNTTCAVAIAHERYGDDWESNFLELNASDERGIDVVRDRIKNFARSSFGGFDYRIIFLDEADSLTPDAQAALRRTMEQFSHNTRFILSCNYSSQIIDPIQSRCAVFRFSPIPDEAVAERIREIAGIEGIELADDGVDALVYAADGDMRKAINALQAAAVLGDTVDEEAVFTITSTARPEDIEAMIEAALDGDFTGARSVLDDLLTEQGLAGGDVIDQLHRAVWDFELDDEAAVRLLDRIGEADYRIAEGANERLQLEALLAAVALRAED